MGADATVYDEIDTAVTTEFVGYEHLTFDSEVTVLTTETEIVNALTEGQKGTIFTKETPSMPPWAARKAIPASLRLQTEDLQWRIPLSCAGTNSAM